MAVQRCIGSLDDVPAWRETTVTPHQVATEVGIGFGVSGLIDGNSDVLLYLTGLSIEARLTKGQARRLADLLHTAADI